MVSQRERSDDDGHGDNYIDRNSPDQNARFGRKSDAKQFYGYKQHIIIDGDSEIIEAVKVTAGNIKDEQIVEPLLDKAKLAADGRKKTKILADKGYDTNCNHQLITTQYRSKSFVMVKKNRW